MALLLYLLYEGGISAYTDIRVGLLLVYPALLLAFLFWSASLLLYVSERRRSNASR